MSFFGRVIRSIRVLMEHDVPFGKIEDGGKVRFHIL